MEKTIREFVGEGKIETLQDYINRGLISDRNFNDILRYAKETSESKFRNFEKLKKVLEEKGLYSLKWDRGIDPTEWIVDLFMRSNCEDVLNKIAVEGGLYKIGDLDGGKNIFKEFCSDFIVPATELAYKSVGGSANAGQYELLLKLILKGVTKGSKGDVTVDGEEMEVKACGKSGAHAAGQKGVGQSSDIYYILDKYCFSKDEELNDDSRKELARNISYLTNKGRKKSKANQASVTGIDTFYSAVSNSGIDEEHILLCLFLGILYQYRYATGMDTNSIQDIVSGKKKLTGNFRTLYDGFAKLLKGTLLEKKDEFVDRIFDAIGAVQLYLYQMVEGFGKFIIAYLNSSNENDPMNGEYHMFMDPEKEFLDISNTIRYISFGTLDNASSTQGRTGKMYIRKQ